mmetsp:Transcript_21653/g.32320  ORF Transcript_21653/g.32320 Transcript_21653/m.32320 type:complete len:345 (-) Transcript_21653:498-1532(-)|eukprot:CAMPEP_0116028080 /NCGR_PEP_ID=MMETSP0321-20121206/15147_1 /TAXON_ID=163516 /ORGANISM="Leptocylindrus danicus var. danicus, Strain B650" /LENGTH=344 /DNA_ID=CAMNT_0003501829 /DNA_START=136 /DNA_END=1170 /DNA_ORIENTATION=-
MKFYSQCIATLCLATSAFAFVVQKSPATSFVKPKTDSASPATELNVYAYKTQTRSRTLETRPYGERAFRMDRDRSSSGPMRMMRYDDYYYRGTDGYGYGGGRGSGRYGYNDYERDSELGYGRGGGDRGYGRNDYYNNYRSSRTYRSPFTSSNGSLGGGSSYYNNGRYYSSGGYGRDRDYYGSAGGYGRDRDYYGGGYGRDRDYYGGGYGRGYGRDRDYYGGGGYGRGVLRSDAFNRYGGNYHNDGYRYGGSGSVYADTRPFENYDYDRSSRYVNADYRSRNYYNRDNYGYSGGYGGYGRGGYGGDYYGGYNSGYGMGNRGGRWSSDAYGRRSSSTYRNSFNVYG